MRAGILDGLDAEQRRLVMTVARRRQFRRGEVVFHEGDPGDSIVLIRQGHVAIRTTTPGGDTATFTVYGPGEAFGEGALLASDAVRQATAVALDRVEAHSLHRREFDRLRTEHPAVDAFLIAVLHDRTRQLSDRLIEALFVPADVRVARRLAALADLFAGDPLVVPVTQDDLASLAGTTRQTTNQVLRRAASDAVLELARGRITILDRAGLDRLAR